MADPFSNLAPRLGVSMTGLTFGPSARAQIEWAGQVGFRGIVLSAAAPGLRPRELDRSARRDVAALLRRMELTFTGVDLLIPKSHFVDAERSDRALSAANQALAFAAEMGGLCEGPPVLSLELPREGPDAESVRASLATEAARVGALIAEVGWPPLEPAPEDLDRIGVGLDPAAVLLAGADPSVEAMRVSNRIRSARISDLDAAGRATPGEGRLDLAAYAAALTTSGYSKCAVLDLRGLRDQQSAARAVMQRWGGPAIR